MGKVRRLLRFDSRVLAELERRHDDVLVRLSEIEQRIDRLLESLHRSEINVELKVSTTDMQGRSEP